MSTELPNSPTRAIRFFARLIDYALFYSAGVFLSFLSPLNSYEIFYFAFALAVPLFFIPIEALWISTWKTTAGKAFFQIFVQNENGKNLTYSQALKRIFSFGKGPGILVQKPLNWKRKVLGILGSFFVIFGSIAGTVFKDFSSGFAKYERNHEWVHYYSEEAGFEVDFPTDPEMDTKEVSDGLELKEFTSATNNVFYSVSYMDFPSKWRWVGTKTLLKKAVDLIVQHTEEAELVDKKLTVHKSLPAIDFIYKQGNDDVRGRLVLVNTRIFKLTVSYPSSISGQLEKDAFLESFDLTP